MTQRVRPEIFSTAFRLVARVFACVLFCVLGLGVMAAGAADDIQPPTIPGSVVVTTGTVSPTIATITWSASTDDSAVQGYHVWRSTAPAGAQSLLGGTTALTFVDTSGVPGQSYYYRVSAYDFFGNESAKSDPPAGPVSATWTQAPHAPYNSASRICRMCHAPHVADTPDTLLRDAGTTSGEVGVCYTCHDGQGAQTNIATGAENSFALSSGHAVEQMGAGGDLTNSCSGCHAPHVDYTTNRMLPRTSVNGTAVTGANNTWCLACHNDANSWYGAGYPATPTVDATGYPTAGVFPGRTVYLSGTNPHASIPASATVDREAGDCLYCHASHRAPNGYDGLLETFRPTTTLTLVADQTNGTYAESCFDCHGGATGRFFASPGPTNATNIKQFVTSSGYGAGHRVQASGGTLPQGAPLPCYDCHNPHGSAEATAGLQVTVMTGGSTTVVIGDDAGELDLGTAAGQREFCFTCHTTSGSASPNTDAYGWDGDSYEIVGVGAEFEGISRTSRDSGNGWGLKLPPTSGHYRDDAMPCYGCHGDDYSTPGGSNVHNPGAGGSTGGANCLACHGASSVERYDKMTNDTSTYHHVLDAADPGQAPKEGTYPSSTDSLACTSCHTDHNYFNTNKGANLRQGIGLPGSATVNSDFPGGGTYGVCISCHSSALTKNTTGQKTTGASSSTPAISGANYDASKHDYLINDATKVGYDGTSAFRANCIKCHDDWTTGPSLRQDGTYKLAPHYSAENRLASALGASFAGASTSTEENLCFACHITAGGSATDLKTAAGMDAYGITAMSSRSEGIYANITGSTSSHDVTAYSGKHVADEQGAATSPMAPTTNAVGLWGTNNANKHIECEDCHNPHESQAASYSFPNANTALRGTTLPLISGANAGVSGVDISGATGTNGPDWAGSAAAGGGAPVGPTYTTNTNAEYEWQLCLKCHSRYAWGNQTANKAVPSGGMGDNTVATSGTFTDVGKDFDPANYAYHPLFAQGLNRPDPATKNTANWNSAVGRRNINGTNTGNGLSNTFTDGWLYTSRVTCSDCHYNNDAAGTRGPHGSSNKWLIRGYNTGTKVTIITNNTGPVTTTKTLTGVVATNFCANCHRSDVYGLGDGLYDGTSYLTMSRANHNGPFSSCVKFIYGQPFANCSSCHGGRAADANPTDGVTANGLIHGSSMPKGVIADGDPLGKRFTNGASWIDHRLGAGATAAGCSTIGTGDDYTSCAQHGSTTGWKKTFSLTYDY